MVKLKLKLIEEFIYAEARLALPLDCGRIVHTSTGYALDWTGGQAPHAPLYGRRVCQRWNPTKRGSAGAVGVRAVGRGEGRVGQRVGRGEGVGRGSVSGRASVSGGASGGASDVGDGLLLGTGHLERIVRMHHQNASPARSRECIARIPPSMS